MPFHDEATYSRALQHRHTLSSSLLSHLHFHPTHPTLASLSTTSTLTLTNLPALSHTRLALPRCTSLVASSEALYLSSPTGLLATDWHLSPPRPFLPHLPTRRLCLLPHHNTLVAHVAHDAHIALALIDPRRPDHFALLHAPHTPTALLPVSRAAFLVGFADGSVRQYDARATRAPARVCVGKAASGAVTALCASADASFVLVGDARRNVHTVYMPAAAPMPETALKFVPRAAGFAQGSFFVGGSDRKAGERGLAVVDFEGRVTGRTPTSAGSVYALAVREKGDMAVAGFSPEKRALGRAAEVVDVYVHPPVRSYSFEV